MKTVTAQGEATKGGAAVEPLTFTDCDDPPEASVLAIEKGLDAHNEAAAPMSDVRSLAAFATEASGRIVGGATGWTWGACCELRQLWVDPAHRAGGVASRLLERFEARAAARGCSVYYLTTMSFQAPDFYRKHGYAPIAEISGYPDGITKCHMYKEAHGVAAAPADVPGR